MPAQTYSKIIDELTMIDFCGDVYYCRYSEPLADKIILTRLREAREKLPNAKLTIITNGDYLTSSYIDELADVGLDYLLISKYPLPNKKSSFEEQMQQLIEFAGKLNLEYENCGLRNNAATLRLLHPKLHTTIVSREELETFATNRAGTVNSSQTQKLRDIPCTHPFTSVYIDYEGKVAPCCPIRPDIPEHRDWIMGDVNDEPLWDIFTNTKYSLLRYMVKDYGTQKIYPCSVCDDNCRNIIFATQKRMQKIAVKDEFLKYLKKSDFPLVLYGAAKLGKSVKYLLDKHNIKIDFVATDKKYWQAGQKFFDFEVQAIEDVLANSENTKVNIVVAFYCCGIEERANELNNLPNVQKTMLFEDFDFERANKASKELNYLEVDLAEHCNLDCAYCTHNCPVAEPKFPSIEQFEQDFIKLSKLTGGYIALLRLLGGEPLLNPEIVRFMKIARANIPHGIICVVTNGILLAQMKDEFWVTCKENNITVRLSPYPIKLNIEKIKKIASEYGVELCFGDSGYRKGNDKFWMQKLDESGKFDFAEAHKNCFWPHCTFLKDGKIYLCATAPCSAHLNERFGLNFQVSEDDYIALDEAENLQKILEFIKKPSPFCRYCATEEKQIVEWRVSEKKKEEWIVDEEKSL